MNARVAGRRCRGPFWKSRQDNRKEILSPCVRRLGLELLEPRLVLNGTVDWDDLDSHKWIAEPTWGDGIEVDCTKDGGVFEGDLEQYDAIAFFTCCGNLTRPNKRNTPPMSLKGKQRLLDAIAAGKGFVGFHCTSYSWPSRGPRDENQTEVDPFIAMVGGEFVGHGPQQEAEITIASPNFPGMKGLGKSFKLHEEWLALKNFAKNLHVILLQETEGMKGGCYQRPRYPTAWARPHGKGRIFYTSLAHREETWSRQMFQQLVSGGFAWALGNVQAELAPNIDKVVPNANRLKNQEL